MVGVYVTGKQEAREQGGVHFTLLKLLSLSLSLSETHWGPRRSILLPSEGDAPSDPITPH
jgi:hypothetical protein